MDIADVPRTQATVVLEKKLKAISRLGRPALYSEFEKVYGQPPAKRLSDSTLRLAIAYCLQEQTFGGLKPSVRRDLLAGSQSSRPVSAGTLLIREWHGTRHTVIVHADHIEYSGARYRSLTEVAFLITGHKRSGPYFFGLKRGDSRG